MSGRSFGAGLAVLPLAAFFGALAGGSPWAGIVAGVALTGGAMSLRPVTAAGVRGVLAGIATFAGVGFGMVVLAISNADF